MKIEEKEQIILSYDSNELKNFNLLNQTIINNSEKNSDEENFDIAGLQSELNQAIEDQEFEKAAKLQKKIDKIVNK